jgi:hypothetical protein
LKPEGFGGGFALEWAKPCWSLGAFAGQEGVVSLLACGPRKVAVEAQVRPLHVICSRPSQMSKLVSTMNGLNE